MDRRSFLSIGLGAVAGVIGGGAVGQPFPPPTPVFDCRAFCIRDHEWWRWNMSKIPYGLILIPFFNSNQLTSTVNKRAIEIALGQGLSWLSPQRQLIARFVAAQLSLLRARGQAPEDPFLAAPLRCYGFTATLSLSGNVIISGDTTIKELWAVGARVSTTAPANNADCTTLTDVFQFLANTCSLFS